MKRTSRTVIVILMTIFGSGIALLAAFTGGIGPEPPRTAIAELVSRAYDPYFMFFCEPLGGVGFIIAVVVHGLFIGAISYILTRTNHA